MVILNDKLICQIKIQKEVKKRLEKIELLKDYELFYTWLSYSENQIRFGQDLYNYLIKMESFKNKYSLTELFYLLLNNKYMLDRLKTKHKVYKKEKIM